VGCQWDPVDFGATNNFPSRSNSSRNIKQDGDYGQVRSIDNREVNEASKIKIVVSAESQTLGKNKNTVKKPNQIIKNGQAKGQSKSKKVEEVQNRQTTFHK
jgi:hypothetical protein